MDAKQMKQTLLSCSLSSICSSLITHPIDVVKVTCQTNVSSSPFTAINKNIKKEGFSFFYRGFTASIMRNGIFVTTKMFAYDCLKQEFNVKTFQDKLLCGMSAGFCGAVVGAPFDLLMVRMQNDKAKYPNITTTIQRTYINEGIFGFWKGIYYTTCRAMIVSACQFAVYEQMKQELEKQKRFTNPYYTFGCSSITSSLLTSIVSNPFDLCKTRTINKHPNNTIQKIIKNEGWPSLRKGLLANIARQIPLNLIRFSFLEFFRKHI
jgi:hypothetical protein